MKYCFLNANRMCISTCTAFIDDTKSNTACRLINTFEKLIPIQSRPVAPTPPSKVKT